MKFGIIVFPGSNCDHDCHYAITEILGHEAVYIWHLESQIDNCDCVIIPGGFSYGDYLRVGAIASKSPIMNGIINFAKKGYPVIGICNGFQILLESGLLPGAMIRNKKLKFICKDIFLKIEDKNQSALSNIEPGRVIKMPIAHNDGAYFADPKTLNKLEQNGQILFRYCDANGNVSENCNPNGSVLNIAGISNEDGNVLGMMPHPERAMENLLQGEDGRLIFESVLHRGKK